MKKILIALCLAASARAEVAEQSLTFARIGDSDLKLDLFYPEPAGPRPA